MEADTGVILHSIDYVLFDDQVSYLERDWLICYNDRSFRTLTVHPQAVDARGINYFIEKHSGHDIV